MASNATEMHQLQAVQDAKAKEKTSPVKHKN
jgi:hypothetical protein